MLHVRYIVSNNGDEMKASDTSKFPTGCCPTKLPYFDYVCAHSHPNVQSYERDLTIVLVR